MTIHGMHGTSTYWTWATMLQRCNNPNVSNFKYYGGRGIKVCKRWNDFKNFFEDMGPRPSDLTLDRRNNAGNYESSNCRWATRKEQSNNRRPNSCGRVKQKYFRAINKEGVEYQSNNQNEFAKQYGLRQSTISACLEGRLKQHKNWRFQWLIHIGL